MTPAVASAAVPERLDGAPWTGPAHQAAPGAILVDIPLLGRAYVRTGEEPAVELADGIDELDARWFRDVPVGQAARLLEGRFALRAAAVSVGGRAVAIMGPGAFGKSTVAAGLARRGHPILADGELELAVEGERVTALARGGALALWPVDFEELGLGVDAGAAIRPELGKRMFKFPAAPDGRPLELVVRLDRRVEAGHAEVHEVRGAERMGRIVHNTILTTLVEPTGLAQRHFTWAARVAGSARVVRIGLNDRVGDIDAVAGAIEEQLA